MDANERRVGMRRILASPTAFVISISLARSSSHYKVACLINLSARARTLSRQYNTEMDPENVFSVQSHNRAFVMQSPARTSACLCVRDTRTKPSHPTDPIITPTFIKISIKRMTHRNFLKDKPIFSTTKFFYFWIQ